MEIEELKPCPFCGSKLGGGAVARQHPVKKFRAKAKEQSLLAFAYCSKCGACGPVSHNAFESWQSRVDVILSNGAKIEIDPVIREWVPECPEI